MNEESSLQKPVDVDQLKLLAFGYFLLGALHVLVIYFGIQAVVLLTQLRSEYGNNAPGATPDFSSSIGPMVAGLVISFSIDLIFLVLNVLSGIFLFRIRFRLFSLIVAGINLLSFPLGTVLGAFTFMSLFRKSVKALYAERIAMAAKIPSAPAA